jgi:hypothetical protein
MTSWTKSEPDSEGPKAELASRTRKESSASAPSAGYLIALPDYTSYETRILKVSRDPENGSRSLYRIEGGRGLIG